MAAEENKVLIRRVIEEGFNQGRLGVVDEVFDANFVDLAAPEQAPGIEGVKAYIRKVRTGFPDISVTIEDLIAEGDKVVVRTRWSGTHAGEYEGLAPTGKQAHRTMIQIFQVVNGKLFEEWSEGGSLKLR